MMLKNVYRNEIIYPRREKYQTRTARFLMIFINPCKNFPSALARVAAKCYFSSIMVKQAEKIIFIQDFDGGRTPFNPVELQARLIQCFLDAGLRDSSYMAEDIALAVEYALRNSPRPEPVFGRGELAAAVIRMLEETGFPEVAALFRSSGGDRQISIDTEPGPISGLLAKFLACSPERLERITEQVCDGMKKLEISAASPHLLLELARHYERLSLEPPGAPAAPAAPAAAAVGRELPADENELARLLPEQAQYWMKRNVLRISGISTFFPCIRIFFLLRRYAAELELPAPVTELEIMPHLYEMANLLEACRDAIECRLVPAEPLPIYLSIPDMSTFITHYLGGEWPKSEKLGRELAAALASGFRREIYKLSLS